MFSVARLFLAAKSLVEDLIQTSSGLGVGEDRNGLAGSFTERSGKISGLLDTLTFVNQLTGLDRTYMLGNFL